MLACVDESKGDLEIVVGGGVPEEWLKETVSLKNYRSKAGVISWEYRNGDLQVAIAGAAKRYPVRPGIAFRQNHSKLTVRYE